MTLVRLVFYVTYIAFGVIIIAKLLATGLRPQLIPGLVLGILLIILGVYRLASVFQARANR
ncbi:MAG: hypothetical protein M3M96_07015 [Candidatus Eremiobacteraeota bacterium]|nr:hypothetical protein [Candidatus Eremiobacteraeota bacterium]